MSKNYYEILGIELEADIEDIKLAFRSLARQYHPDSGSPTASHQLFQEITEAYDVLSNVEKRARYDAEHGFAEKLREKAKQSTSGIHRRPSRVDLKSLQSRMQAQQVRPAPQPQSPSPEPSPADKSSSFVHKLFSKVRPPSAAPANEATSSKIVENKLRGNRQFSFSIDIFESFFGTTREVVLNENDSADRYTVKIPAGVENDSVHILEAEGTGLNALELIESRIHVTPHAYVDRQGLDIILKVPVSFVEALHGTEVTVPTIQAALKVKIPADFNYTNKLRLKDLGLRDASKKKVGDIYIQPFIVLPDQRGEALEHAIDAISQFYRAPVRTDFPQTFRKRS